MGKLLPAVGNPRQYEHLSQRQYWINHTLLHLWLGAGEDHSHWRIFQCNLLHKMENVCTSWLRNRNPEGEDETLRKTRKTKSIQYSDQISMEEMLWTITILTCCGKKKVKREKLVTPLWKRMWAFERAVASICCGNAWPTSYGTVSRWELLECRRCRGVMLSWSYRPARVFGAACSVNVSQVDFLGRNFAVKEIPAERAHYLSWSLSQKETESIHIGREDLFFYFIFVFMRILWGKTKTLRKLSNKNRQKVEEMRRAYKGDT